MLRRDLRGAVALLQAVGAELRVVPALDHMLRRLRRQYEARQEKLLPLLCDELLYPVLRSAEAPAQSAGVRLLCSETSTRHTLLISFRGLAGDPFAAPYLDELNLRLLDSFSEFLFRRQTEDGWEVCIQM